MRTSVSLEADSQRDLHLPRRRRPIRLDVAVGKDSERRCPNLVRLSIRIVPGIEEMRMVENVVAFKAQLSFDALGYAHVLRDCYVPVPPSWPVPLVAFVVGCEAEGWLLESALVGHVSETGPWP